MSNALYYGDNLAVLRRHLQDASVNLVYLDPPFQSGRDYSLSFESRAGDPAPESAHPQAFTDTWRWGHEAEASYAEVARAGGRVPARCRRSGQSSARATSWRTSA